MGEKEDATAGLYSAGAGSSAKFLQAGLQSEDSEESEESEDSHQGLGPTHFCVRIPERHINGTVKNNGNACRSDVG